MSLSSRIDAKMTTARIAGRRRGCIGAKNALSQAAVMRRVRPRREAARAGGAHRNPDLLERAPVIRRPLVPQEPAAVRRLEGEIHLQAAPVRPAGIPPASLVVVDAEPPREMGL